MGAAIALLMACAFFALTQEQADAAKKGLVKKGGHLYYYKGGKPVKNKVVKVKGTKYYFSSKGKGFVSTGSSYGNKAMARVINKVKFTSKTTKKMKLKKCYTIVKKYKFSQLLERAPKSKKGWYKLAYKTAKRKYGMCYSYAAMSAVCAKAMGYKNVKIRYGKVKRPGHKGLLEHAWATVGSRILDGSYDYSHTHYTGSGKLQFFLKTKKQILKNKVYPSFNGRIRYKKISKTYKIA